MLTASAGAQTIVEARAPALCPKVDAAQVDALRADGALVIDTRLAEDYAAGHIEGAISLPVDAGDAIVEALRAVRPDTSLVLYCQSASCPLSGMVAKRLLKVGYQNVYLYTGGWEDWQAHGH